MPFNTLKWYRIAVEQYASIALLRLGWMYIDEKGVEKSDEVAFKWFLDSAELGNKEAQSIVSMLYRTGRGVAQSDFVADKWDKLSSPGIY